MSSIGRVVAIIPARGGSKGIIGKNLVPIAGRPLLAYTIEAAQQAAEVSEVVVSTDSDAIAVFAAGAGATVIRRPTELSGDTASSESALLHTLDSLRERDGREPELVVFLQATSPLRPEGAVSGAIRTLLGEGADSLFSASPVHGFIWKIEGGKPVPVSYDHRRRPPRHEAVEHLEENGSIYLFRPHILRTEGNRMGGRIAVYRMDPIYAAQVDEPPDLIRIARLLEALAERPGGTVQRDR